MMNLNVTTDDLIALIGQLTVENRILRQKLAQSQALVDSLPPYTPPDLPAP